MAKRLCFCLLLAAFLHITLENVLAQPTGTRSPGTQDFSLSSPNLSPEAALINFDDITSPYSTIEINPNRYPGVRFYDPTTTYTRSYLTRTTSYSYPNSLFVGFENGCFPGYICHNAALAVDFTASSKDISFWWGRDYSYGVGTVYVYGNNFQLIGTVNIGLPGFWTNVSLGQYQQVRRLILTTPDYGYGPYYSGGFIDIDNFSFNPITTQSPVGTLESVSTTDDAAIGWSADPDSPNASNFVDCYIDGQLSGRVTANNPGSGAPNPPYAGNHRFSFSIPNSYRDNINHQISCYGIDISGGDPNALLSGSPKTFNLTPDVQSVVFEPVNNVVINGALTSSELDYPTNGYNSQRIFPDKQSPDDVISRKTVRVRAVLGRPNITVYFKNFDVDDPSNDSNIDENGSLGNDNRDGRIIGQAYPPSAAGTLSATSAITNTNGEAIVYFTVTKQPGDNFVVAASTDQSYLNGVAINGTGLKDSANSVLPTNQAKRTELLTVWRKLHMEVDSMGQVTNNFVTGYIKGKGTYVGSAAVWVEVYPATGPGLPGTAGYLEDHSYHETLAADGTRLSYGGRMVMAGVNSLQVLDNRAVPRSPGIPPKSEVQVVSLTGNIYLYPNQPFKLYDDDDFNNSNGSQKDGDDGEDVVPLFDTFSKMQASDNPNENPYASAYIVPENNWAAGQGLNDSNVEFHVYRPFEPPRHDSERILTDQSRGSKTLERDDFWIGYMLIGYQSDEYSDVDETGFTGGVAPNINGLSDLTNIFDPASGVPRGSVSAVIYIEGMRDFDIKAPPGTTMLARNWRVKTAPHELGHQFGLRGDTDTGNGIMGYSNDLYFIPQHINVMRWRVHSPGEGGQ